MKIEIKLKNNKIFAPLKDKWLVCTPEEKVRQTYICRLVNDYGYCLEQMRQEVTVAKGNSRGTGRAQADIVLWRSVKDVEKKPPIIVVECKSDSININPDDYYQGSHYAQYTNSPFFVMTNEKETKVFKVNLKEFPKYLGKEIIDIPPADIVNKEKELIKFSEKTKEFTRDEFAKLLLQCHNIIRNNDKLSPEAAFDEISKILFMKIRYERQNTDSQIFSKKQFEKDKKVYNTVSSQNGDAYYQFLFNNTKDDFKNDDLFEDNEVIRIKESSFEEIVKKLEIYNLSNTSDDVKGIAFETFLGKTFRGELGQFFTPRTVVDFMVEALDPQENEIICDPCCGSGGFLIKAFEYVREKIEKSVKQEKDQVKQKLFDEDYEKASNKIKKEIEDKLDDILHRFNNELDKDKPYSRLRKLSHDCIFGTDANPRMSRTAKMNMIMHGDGHGGVHHNDGLLNVNGIFENRFDVILTNPPFGARISKDYKITEADRFTDEKRIEMYKKRYDKDGHTPYADALEQVNGNIDKKLLNLYETGKMSTLTEVLFIERCLKLLKPGGRMGIVLPEGVLNNTNLQKVRDFVESKAKIIMITSIPQDVFIASGATVKPSLLFLKKFTADESKQYALIEKEAKDSVNADFKDEIESIQDQLNLRGKDSPSAEHKKILRADLKILQQKITSKIKAIIKEKFDYEIPIAEVEKAGISTTGAKIDNELEPLCSEFTTYRKTNNLWIELNHSYSYSIKKEKLIRISADHNSEEIIG